MSAELEGLPYRLCMMLWRQAMSGPNLTLFREMEATPMIGDLVFVDLIPQNIDPAQCIGVLADVSAFGDYQLRLADGTTQRFTNVDLHKVPK